MNTTASLSSEHSSWLNTSSRRNSIESVLSIQGKETDYVRDTSDTEWGSDHDEDLEYEPATEPEDEGPLDGDTSEDTDNQIISTKVIEVSLNDEGDLEFADSEQTDSDGSDSEMELHDYWKCAQCHNNNNNPIYRYCERCFKVRKNFFPPRPKRKQKGHPVNKPVTVHRLVDRDSGVDSAFNSQELTQTTVSGDSEVNLSQSTVNNLSQTLYVDDSKADVSDGKREVDDSKREVDDSKREVVNSTQEVVNSQQEVLDSRQVEEAEKLDKPDNLALAGVMNVELDTGSSNIEKNVILDTKTTLKRRAESADRYNKRKRIDYSDSDSCSDLDNSRKSKSVGPEVQPLSKMNSDPSLTIESIEEKTKIDSKQSDNLCIVCFNEPKSGVFVHGRIAHICCCYKCAVKVWAKSKRCPVCNCKVSNVLKAVVM